MGLSFAITPAFYPSKTFKSTEQKNTYRCTREETKKSERRHSRGRKESEEKLKRQKRVSVETGATKQTVEKWVKRRVRRKTVERKESREKQERYRKASGERVETEQSQGCNRRQ